MNRELKFIFEKKTRYIGNITLFEKPTSNNACIDKKKHAIYEEGNIFAA